MFYRRVVGTTALFLPATSRYLIFGFVPVLGSCSISIIVSGTSLGSNIGCNTNTVNWMSIINYVFNYVIYYVIIMPRQMEQFHATGKTERCIVDCLPGLYE